MAAEQTHPAPRADDAAAADRARRLQRLRDDCRAIAAYDEHMGDPLRCSMGKYQGGEAARAPECETCGAEHTCDACAERARARADAIARGQRLRARLEALRQRGGFLRYQVAAQRLRDQRWLDVLYTLAMIVLVDLDAPVLAPDEVRALVLSWALGAPVDAFLPPRPRPVLADPGPHPVERAASVIDWLVKNHATRADLATACANAFASDDARRAWNPPPPAQQPREQSPSGRAKHEQAREQYRAARARAEADRPAFGDALLALAVDAWFGQPDPEDDA